MRLQCQLAMLGAALALVGASACRAPVATGVVTPDGSLRLRSAVTGRDYLLLVSLPRGYSSSGKTRFPVLYVLDGNDEFARAVEAQHKLQGAHEVPPLIVVGVGYAGRFNADPSERRWADYTPSPDRAADSEWTARADSAWEARRGADRRGVTLQSGGASLFLTSLRTEIIPLIESRYRSDHDRALWGHSLGALFAVYTLFTAPNVFSRYAISSPSLWWNHGETFVREADFAKAHRSLAARVYLSVGADEEAVMTTGVDSLAAIMARRKYHGLTMAAHAFDGENHSSVVPAAFSDAMRFLYAAPKR